MSFGSFGLQWDCLGEKLDIEFVLGAVTFAGEASTSAILAIRFGFVALLLAPTTCARDGASVCDCRINNNCNLTGNRSWFVARSVSAVQAPFSRSRIRSASRILGRSEGRSLAEGYRFSQRGRCGSGVCASPFAWHL